MLNAVGAAPASEARQETKRRIVKEDIIEVITDDRKTRGIQCMRNHVTCNPSAL